MGFATLSPSLYQLVWLDCVRSVRNGPVREASRTGPPIVGSLPIQAFSAVA